MIPIGLAALRRAGLPSTEAPQARQVLAHVAPL
jgi:hypothetical protein